MDELRSKIWDYLFHAVEPQSLTDIAAEVSGDPGLIREAVNHEWFNVTEEKVAIAYEAGAHQHKLGDSASDPPRNP